MTRQALLLRLMNWPFPSKPGGEKMDESFEYYERRAREEHALAESANSKEAASAHHLLAIEYDAQARELRENAALGRAPEGTGAI
jgi:hypothetical protein